MAVFSAEKVQEIVEEKEAEYKKLEEEYSYLKEEYEELEEVCQELKKDKKTLMKANATVLNFYREDCGKMDDLQKLNNKLVKSCKKANRDFFIIAAFLAATLVMMLGMLIR